jgi:1-acyl-sn-glycerol-3-phosphate acyltransferase
MSRTEDRGDAAAIVHRSNGPIARATYIVAGAVLRVFARTYWRLEVKYPERLPDSGGFVIAPVHRSNIDFLLPALITRRKIRWMAKDTLFVDGPAARMLWMFGAYPVHRDGIDRASVRTTLALLADGQPVVMFPEGRRKEGPRILDPFHGPAFAACRERVPIVPIGIGGSDRAMPIGAKFVRPRKVTLVIGEPIYPDVALVGRVPRSKVNELTSELVDELQRLYDESQSSR